MSAAPAFAIAFDDGDGRRIATITFDDGKHNIITADRADELVALLRRAEDADALVLAGRPGSFSAGLDLGVVRSGDRRATAELFEALGRAAVALWTHPVPTVAAVTGHAIAGGAVLALACDAVVSTDGKGQWGLPELTLGLVPPAYVVELARARLRGAEFASVLLSGALVGPARAVEIGFADELAGGARVVARAQERARQLARTPRKPYAAAKQRLRGPVGAALLAGLAADIDDILSVSELEVAS